MALGCFWVVFNDSEWLLGALGQRLVDFWLPGGAVHLPPPAGPLLPGEGVRTNFQDLDPVWERERERVNRDALTRLKTPEGSADMFINARYF